MLGSSRNWQVVGRELARSFHVSALDLRNHGQSPHADEMGYAAMMADVLGWLEARQLARATLLGHSMGGKLAMLLACRDPARVERLIVVDMAPKDYHWVAHRAEFAAMRELDLAHLNSRAEAELRFEARVDDWAMRKFLATNLERGDGGQWRWVINLSAISRALPELEKNVLEPKNRFNGPTLFVTGERSNYVSPDDRPLITRHFPEAKFAVVKASGHNPHIEQRGEFVQAVAEFAAGHR